jgi:predicted permease
MSIPPELTTAVKLLRARKALAATVMALMVGGGLTLAAYSVIHAALLTPLPWSQPDRIVRVWNASSAQEQLRLLDAPAIDTLAGQPRPFSSIAAFLTLQQQLALPSGKTVDVSGALVSDRMFDVLGVHATSGRALTADDSDISPVRPIVISQRLVDAGLVTGNLDDIVRIDDDAYRIVGIVGTDFWFPDKQTRYWAPLPIDRRDAVPATVSYGAIARLAPGVTADVAEAQATAQLAFDGTSRRVRVQSYGDTLLEPIRPALAALEATAASLLALVCLNVAWLFAARARRLTTTFATLRALGATERSVLWTYLLMGALVGLVAAPVVALTAAGLLRVAATLESGTISKVADLALTRGVLIEGLVGTVLGAYLGALPGATLARTQSASRARARRHRVWQLSGMSVQVALVFAVGVVAASFALVLRTTVAVNVGLARTDFSVARLADRGAAATDPTAQVAKLNDAIAHLSNAGVAAAAANILPLTATDSGTVLGPPGLERRQWRTTVRVRVVTSSYFAVTGMHAVRGRVLDGSDVGSSRALVNEDFARSLLPDGNVIGRRVPEWAPYVPWVSQLTFVGVVPAVKQLDFDEPGVPEMYVLYDDYVRLRGLQAASSLQRIFLLASGDAIATMRSVVARDLPDFDASEETTMRTLVGGRLGARRLVGLGSALFAAIGLVLATLGLYAMVSHEIARRAKEHGIRLALGATWRTLAVHTLAPMAVIYGVGIAAGAALLMLMQGLLRAALVPPPGLAYPSLTVVGGLVAAVLALGAALACSAPLARLRRIDPGHVLRAE